MNPLLKGWAIQPDKPPPDNAVKFALWADPAASSGAASLVVVIASPVQDICDEWLKLCKAGLRVTIDGADWRLRQFHQFSSPPPAPSPLAGYWPWPIWNIQLELEH